MIIAFSVYMIAVVLFAFWAGRKIARKLGV